VLEAQTQLAEFVRASAQDLTKVSSDIAQLLGQRAASPVSPDRQPSSDNNAPPKPRNGMTVDVRPHVNAS
jgi:hypothetical protein